MKKQFFLLGAAAIFSFAACNNNGSDTTTTTDSTANANANTTATSTAPTTGTEIANFSSRSFVDLKTKKPIKLKWDTEKHHYTDETGNQPYYYYDPASHDTFDYWGRRLNNYLTYSNGDYTLDESRMSSSMSTTTDTTTTTTTTTGASGDVKVKSKDDKYKEKTDTSKLKVTDDKMKVKKK